MEKGCHVTWYGEHLHLDEIKARAPLENVYIKKEKIPPYPRPEFHVTHLKHDTGRRGLIGIKSDSGFKAFSKNLLWWSLSVTSEDILSAERRLLDETFPERTEEQVQKQGHFLGQFATSPAFLETSRYGSYRFTFPLKEVLDAYREQFCNGEPPTMRVWRTTLYKQKVMYAVLVHSPANEEEFSKYPLLSDAPDSVCAFRDGCFIWRSEAMCETNSFKLVENGADNQMKAEKVPRRHVQYYVWDNIDIVLHMEEGAVLKFDSDRLRKNLKFCEKGKPIITPAENFDNYQEAEERVMDLWPEGGRLERSPKI